jgi:hypothetical protein
MSTKIKKRKRKQVMPVNGVVAIALELRERKWMEDVPAVLYGTAAVIKRENLPKVVTNGKKARGYQVVDATSGLVGVNYINAHVDAVRIARLFNRAGITLAALDGQSGDRLQSLGMRIQRWNQGR